MSKQEKIRLIINKIVENFDFVEKINRELLEGILHYQLDDFLEDIL